MRRLSTTYKLTALLAFLSTAPLIFLVFNRSAESIHRSAQARMLACQQLALSCSLHLRGQDHAAIDQMFNHFIKNSSGLSCIRLVRFDGLVIRELQQQDERSRQPAEAEIENDINIPILRSGRPWGSLQAKFERTSHKAQIIELIKAFSLTISLNVFTFGFLLKRSVGTLESGTAVPRRVRNTLDTIAGGVVILDDHGKIVMANEAFRNSCGKDSPELVGTQLNCIHFRYEAEEAPWETAKRERKRQSGVTLFFDDANGLERCFVVNATPVFDGKETLVGTLVSFEDVTMLEQQKQSLMQTMRELESSKEKIHQQNIRLQELASMDALTGTVNRRTLFERLEHYWAEFKQYGHPVNCIMLDVDHFKKLNDQYGHAVGDDVLRDVARTLRESVGQAGIVGRYGGEEFCVIAPDLSIEDAGLLGEALRRRIESEFSQPYTVTASFGVSGSALGAKHFQAMLEQADQALYAAKNGGRNAVQIWRPDLVSEQEAKAAKLLHMIADADQPISYHAVAALHSALAYRDPVTAVHSQRVAELSVTLGRGLLSLNELYTLEIAAILHDIGKLGVPDAVLFKPTELLGDDWNSMHARFQMGVELVDASFGSKALADIIRCYHYHYDGTGTPHGEPVGEDIPIGARIVAIVDSFDSMISNRAYRGSRTVEEAFDELRRCAGTQFDPKLVELFLDMQIGWRPDSRHVSSNLDCRMAISIGHLTERTMYAFETQDRASLCDNLGKLAVAGQQYELPAIHNVSHQLSKSIANLGSGNWEDVTPILQDLLDMCLMVQRAHIRDVAMRPQLVSHRPIEKPGSASVG